jgi:OmcA/MtrC family decaheme c-type cytochrome
MRMPSSLSTVVRIALVLLVVAGSVALIGSSQHPYSPREKAYYADPALVAFVRPGLNITINSAQLSSSGALTVNYTLADPMGLPLDASGVTTPGVVATTFIAAYIPKGQEQYVALTTAQATGQALGTITRPTFEESNNATSVGPGQYQYTFMNPVPAGFDPTTTYTVAVVGSRDLTEFNLGTNYAGATFNFVPNGAAVTVTRDVIRTQSCNKCHDQLAFHGGHAVGMDMCVMCHQPQNADPVTGNTLDLKVMVHKIHMGSSLPSVLHGTPYQIIGYRNSVNDFSTVVDPSEAQRCEVCHDQTTGAAQANVFMTKPSRAACGACHDDVNFATGGSNWDGGATHAGGFQPDDSECANCHIPQGERPFDASILGAHVVTSDTATLYPPNPDTVISGIDLAITGVTNTSAGQTPTVTFTLQDDKGNPIPLANASTLQFTMAGPTTDYGYTSFGSDTASTPGYVTESAKNATCDSNSNCSYTFTHAIPANATGTYSMGGEARMTETVFSGTTSQMSVTEGASNPVTYFSVDGSPVQERRTVVALANCNQCHTALSLHGSLRNNTQYCVMCHNPSNTDASTRAMAQNADDAAAPPQGISFAMMIHRIHDGVNVVPAGGKPYIIVGHGGSHNDFSDVLFPAMTPSGQTLDLQNCSLCHTNDSQQNLPIGLNPVMDPQGWYTPAQTTASACSGCHVSKSEAAHFLANTDPNLGESCDVCHGANAQFSVDQEHAQ